MDCLTHTLLLLCALGGVASLPTHSPVKEVVAFGDSFSDNGNAFALTNGTWPADPAYFQGRFSEGPVWVEVLANKLGKLNDFAFGGATSDDALAQGFTGPQATIEVPSAVDQVAAYLGGAKTSDVGDNLFTILIGANDIFFNANATAQAVVGNVAGIIQNLKNHGVNKFLVASYPDFDRFPAAAFNTPEINQGYHEYSLGLHQELAKLAASHPQVAYANLFGLFNEFVTKPHKFGFDPSVTGKSCLTGVYSSLPRTLCEDPDKYIFWDEYHPTSKTHKLIADFALKVVKKHFK